MKFKSSIPEEKHKAFRDECLALLNKHGGHLPAVEMLAIASHMVGQLLALQDQRLGTAEDYLKLVSQNINTGNAEAIKELLGRPLGSA